MPKRTISYRDALLDDLQNPDEAASYLNAALDDSNEMFLRALRDVAAANQMSKVAEVAGVARESVYRMLTETGNPTYTNLLSILRALGLKIAIAVENKPTSLRPSTRDDNDTAVGELAQSHNDLTGEREAKDQQAGGTWSQLKSKTCR